MAENEKEPEIKVNDRRRVRSEESAAASPSGDAAPKDAPAGSAPETGPKGAVPRPPIDFTTFLLSLASTAVIQMGAAPDPTTGEVSKNIVLARETIDLLGMLREKTRGNLTDEEQQFFDALLYDLRMRFLEASRGGA